MRFATNTLLRPPSSVGYSIRNGIGLRQGGILSPFSLIFMLTHSSEFEIDSDLGCYIDSTYIGCLAYADDFFLLSSSVSQLQDMLKLCSAHAEDLDIKFNATKSCLLKICKNPSQNIHSLQIGTRDVLWYDKIKYLGMHNRA